MKPPIASPFPEPERGLTGRLEWDEEKDCFVFFYLSSLKGRLRCEWVNGKHNWFGMIGVMFPGFLPLMYLTQLAKSKQRPDRWEIYAWGFQENYDVRTARVKWKEISRIFLENGDLFMLSHAFYRASYFVTREDFADVEEGCKIHDLLKSLWENQGENWKEVKQQFKT